MLWYGLIFIGLVVVVIIEVQFVLSRSGTLSQQETDLNAQISTLTSRNLALSSLSPEVINASKQIAQILPPENSVLLVTSQIRAAAVLNKINLKNLTTSASEDITDPQSGIINLTVLADGQAVDILSFLSSITKLAPLIQLDSVNLATSPTSTVAQISLFSYWSPFPTQLPAITEPISALSTEETTLLEELAKYSTPVVVQDFESSNSAIVVNTAPFSVAK